VSVTTPGGFRASGVTAGLKASGRPDVALVVNDGPRFDAAAVYTSNRCTANPVRWSVQASADGVVHAVLLNSGGANCYTGPAGFEVTRASAHQVAAALGIRAEDVVVCSTGMIGEPIVAPRLATGITAALGALSGDGGEDAATAIMTTDTRAKNAAVTDPAGWSVGGMAKGAGMIAPGLATMLVVLTTDAVAEAAVLDGALRAATRRTFDRLDGDGCMSTNDTVVLLASGASGIAPSPESLGAAVHAVCHDLAMQLIDDAEGAAHVITLEVVGAADEADALEVGHAVARSNLFKCAIFGQDPNWGRILAAVGTTAARFEPDALDVAINGVWVCRDGQPGESRSLIDLSGRQVAVRIDLKAGDVAATVWTNDLTHDYVHENSAYST